MYQNWRYFLYVIIVLAMVEYASLRPRRINRNYQQRHVFKPVVLQKKLYCSYNNRTYESGEKFRPEPCTYCHCPKHNNRVQCAIQDCKFQANCVRYSKAAGECCGQCVEIGCKHTNGQIYKPNAIVNSNQCEQCRCPSNGGRVQCTKVKCPAVNCVNPVKRDNECCERCPDGENCWLEARIIPARTQFKMGECRICQCPRFPLPFWMKGKKIQAVCFNTCV